MAIRLKLELNWGSSGFLDETAYLVDHDVKWGWVKPTRPIFLDPVAPVGEARFWMKNDSRRYTNAESFGIFMPQLTLGCRIRLSCVFTYDSGEGYTVVVFEGFLRRIEPDSGQFGTAQVVLVCEDWLGPLQREFVSIAYDAVKEVDNGISQLINLAIVELGKTIEDANEDVHDWGSHWRINVDTVFDSIWDLCFSFGGRFWQARNGHYIYAARGSLDDGPSNSVDLRNLQGMKVEFTDKFIVNKITAIVHPFDTSSVTNVVLCKYPTVATVDATTTREISMQFRDAPSGRYLSSNSVVTLVPTTDYVINSEPDGSGTNYTADPGIVITQVNESNRAILTIANGVTPADRIYFTKLQVRGVAITSYDPIIVEAENSASIADYGVYAVELDLKCQWDDEWTQSYIDDLVEMYSEPRWVPYSVTVRADEQFSGLSHAYLRHIGSWFKLFDAQTIDNLAVRVVGGRYWKDKGIHMITYYLEPRWE